jgi:hypothetical protein
MIAYGEESASCVDGSLSLAASATRVVLFDEADEGKSASVKIQKITTAAGSPTTATFVESPVVTYPIPKYMILEEADLCLSLRALSPRT